MFTRTALPIAAIVTAAAFVGCETAPKSEEAKSTMMADADATVQSFKEADESMSKFFDSATGWAVFPEVGKGGIGVGGAYGKGVLYEGGKAVGYCDLTQGSIGFQLGGQVYREIVFFENDDSLESFKSGTAELSAQVSAVAASAGVSADADYAEGVCVFTQSKAGLMYEASVGGQGFSYEAF